MAYHLCEQALAVDPNNDRAMSFLSTKYWLPVGMGVSADPKADLERVGRTNWRPGAIALNPNADHQHNMKAMVLLNQARYDESIAGERTGTRVESLQRICLYAAQAGLASTRRAV